MSFSERLKQAREMAGLTQLELAKRLNITKSSICNYENGVSSPKEEIMLRIFDALNVTPNFLFQDSFESVDSSTCCHYSDILDRGQPPTDEELTIIRKLRALTPRDRAVVLSTLDTLYQTSGGEKHYPSASAL